MNDLNPADPVRNVDNRESLASYGVRVIFNRVYVTASRFYQCKKMVMRVTHLQQRFPPGKILHTPNHTVNPGLQCLAKLPLEPLYRLSVKRIIIIDIRRYDIFLIAIQKRPDIFLYKTRLLTFCSPQKITGFLCRQKARIERRQPLSIDSNPFFYLQRCILVEKAQTHKIRFGLHFQRRETISFK